MAFFMREGKHSTSPGRTFSTSRFLSGCNSCCNPLVENHETIANTSSLPLGESANSVMAG